METFKIMPEKEDQINQFSFRQNDGINLEKAKRNPFEFDTLSPGSF